MSMYHDDDWNDRPPSHDELMRYEADCLGEGKPDVEWVLTDYDVWMRNPHFTGKRTEGHPEDERHEDESCSGHMCGPPPMDPPLEVTYLEYVDDSSPMPWDPGWEELDGEDDIPF